MKRQKSDGGYNWFVGVICNSEVAGLGDGRPWEVMAERDNEGGKSKTRKVLNDGTVITLR